MAKMTRFTTVFANSSVRATPPTKTCGHFDSDRQTSIKRLAPSSQKETWIASEDIKNDQNNA